MKYCARASAVVPDDVAMMMGIVQFWNPQNHPEESGHRDRKPVERKPQDPREWDQKMIARHMGISKEQLTELGLMETWLIRELIDRWNQSAALEAINNPQLLSQQHDLLIKAAALRVDKKILLRSSGYQGLTDDQIEEVKAEIEKIHQDRNGWMTQLQKELVNLQLN